MSSWKIKPHIPAALLFSCISCIPAWYAPKASAEGLLQTAPISPGQLQVTVTDQNGQPLALVAVIVQQNDKTLAQERTTPSGSAVLRQLTPGSYRVLVEKQGFYTTVVPKLVIVSGQPVPLEVRLQPVRE
jgi:hypothetical protein